MQHVDQFMYKGYFTDEMPEVWEGNFFGDKRGLKSIKGSPKRVTGVFDVCSNGLTSLEGAPEELEYGFHCANNKITNLIGLPRKIEGNLNCSRNKLKTLEGCPEIITNVFQCEENRLISLKHCPKYVGCWFYCQGNNILPSEHIYVLFSVVKDKIRTDYDSVNEILMEGRIDGKMPRELIPGKINELRDMDNVSNRS
jgi:hypothetical protein